MNKKTAQSAKPKQPGPPTAEPASEEQILCELQKALNAQSLFNSDEVKPLLQSLMGQVLKPSPADLEAESLKDQAQELAFDAMEADTEEQARDLAGQALAKDPDCVDALVVLASIDSGSPLQMIESLHKAVESAERSLGPQFIADNAGNFWGLLETRPYMRSLEQLASLLRAEGYGKEAIRFYEKMLALNPNDNQGVRDPLLGLYLASGCLEEAGKLLAAYQLDCAAAFAWGRVLHSFLSGNLPAADAALKQARKQNRFVERYLAGQKKMPEYLPNMYESGSDEEAILCADSISLAWAEHQPAMTWLMDRLKEKAAPKKKPARPSSKANGNA